MLSDPDPDVLAMSSYDNSEPSCAVQGMTLEDLAALQELRITTDIAGEGFAMHLEGLPPSLRHLDVTHGMKPSDRVRKLLILAPPCPPDQLAAGDRTPARVAALLRAAAAQPTAPAIPGLLSLVLRCPMLVLPASLQLRASCAVTLISVNLTVMRSRDHSPLAETDRKRVILCSPALLQLA